MTDKTPVMLIDDDDDMRASLAQMLMLAGYEVRQAHDGREAIDQLDRDFAGALVTDVRMPRMDGLELLAEVQRLDHELPVILMTGHGDISMAVAAMKAGAWDFLTKPFDPDALTRAVNRAADKRRLVIENRMLRSEAEQGALRSPIIGRAPAIEQLRHTLTALAETPLDLLIEGESGTGKELAARTLHHATRGAKRFVVLPCSGITEAMVEQTLFGINGPIAAADGGTLFVDDLQRANPLLQSKLIEFAERRLIGDPGERHARPITCRIVSTVSAQNDLSVLDPALVYRVSGMRIALPPLRERREDIPLLLTHFLGQSARTHRREIVQPGHELLNWAMAHEWTGNIRELETYAERLTLGLETTSSVTEEMDLASRVDAFERTQIVEALTASGGNVVDAIERLGIARKTFYYKANRLRIDPSHFRKGRRDT